MSALFVYQHGRRRGVIGNAWESPALCVLLIPVPTLGCSREDDRMLKPSTPFPASRCSANSGLCRSPPAAHPPRQRAARTRCNLVESRRTSRQPDGGSSSQRTRPRARTPTGTSIRKIHRQGSALTREDRRDRLRHWSPSAACERSSACSFRLRGQIHPLYGERTLQPGVEPAEQRPNARDALSLERQRHPGARRFVRSRADQHDVPVSRDLGWRPGDRLGSDPPRFRDRVRRSSHFQGCS
jgi:hypothetical protein